MSESTGTTSPVNDARTTPWPEGVVARYLTVAGATVDIVDKGIDERWRYDTACTGCPHKDMSVVEEYARRDAQRHASVCRALPRPAVTA
ncbi:hypothetical protein WKI71_36680 [Streptomyces sp. MS1.AVA.1]|uniref:Uncharacterized protein n=1 Tax=Streptomyces machairae TaxID=3134109 RepID=A0ABU8USL5_9ACTN